MGTGTATRDGSLDYQGGLPDGDGPGEHPLARHPAVRQHGQGVPTTELAQFIQLLTDAAKDRVAGVGDEQYGGEVLQKFERASIDDYVGELLEEVYDIQAYLAIIALKVIALRESRR